MERMKELERFQEEEKKQREKMEAKRRAREAEAKKPSAADILGFEQKRQPGPVPSRKPVSSQVKP